MLCESCFRVPNGPSIVPACSIDFLWQVTTHLDRFLHSRSMIEDQNVEKVVKISILDQSISDTFSTVWASIIDLECGNRPRFVVVCWNRSILQADTILGPLGTRKQDSHHIQGPTPPPQVTFKLYSFILYNTVMTLPW